MAFCPLECMRVLVCISGCASVWNENFWNKLALRCPIKTRKFKQFSIRFIKNSLNSCYGKLLPENFLPFTCIEVCIRNGIKQLCIVANNLILINCRLVLINIDLFFNACACHRTKTFATIRHQLHVVAKEIKWMSCHFQYLLRCSRVSEWCTLATILCVFFTHV